MIAIVDDDASVREATRCLVKSLGYKAATFGSAEAFLASDGLDETACLITDVRMPGLSGLDLQDHLVESGRTMPVIFVTALPEESTQMRAFRGGAVGFFHKPFDEAGLIECLARAMAEAD